MLRSKRLRPGNQTENSDMQSVAAKGEEKLYCVPCAAMFLATAIMISGPVRRHGERVPRIESLATVLTCVSKSVVVDDGKIGR